MIEIKSLMSGTNNLNPLKISYSKNSRYYNDFILVLSKISIYLTEKEIRDLVVNKLQLSKSTYDQESYLEAATEISVIAKMASLPVDSFVYEKPIRTSTKKNPECTIKSGKFTVNVEAKCPRIPELPKSENARQKILVMKSAGRVTDFNRQFQALKTQLEDTNPDLFMVVGKNKDNTMKDFLQSAHEKFADFRDENELNVLFVSLDDIHNIQDWWNYLHQNEGLLTLSTFELPSTFSRVDVIILSNLLFRHKNCTKIKGSAWNLDDSFALFLSSAHRQADKKEAHYYLIPKIINLALPTIVWQVASNPTRLNEIKWLF